MAYIEDLIIEGSPLKGQSAVRGEAPFPYIAVEKMVVTQRMGEHAYGELELLLAQEEGAESPPQRQAADGGAELIKKLDSGVVIRIKIREQVLFCGIICKVKVRSVNQVIYLKLELAGCSYNMDIQKKSRSFQNPGQSYIEIFKTIAGEYGGYVTDHGNGGDEKGASLLQYLETDWEFLKRLASLLHTTLYPDCRFDTPKLHLGVNPGNCHKESPPQGQSADGGKESPPQGQSADGRHVTNHNYTIVKDNQNFLLNQVIHPEWNEGYEISYQLELPDNFELGDKVTYFGVPLTIFEKITELVNTEILHCYSLKVEKGIAVRPVFNHQIRGASISGTVLAVKNDRLKVHLSIDEKQQDESAYWYSFETPYANEGGTGWYWMPQVGDQVNLYVAGEDERKAVVRSVSRTDSNRSRMQNPANKYLGSPYGSGMTMTPSNLTFSGGNGKMCLTLHQSQGVKITSHEKIMIGAGAMGLECKSLELSSKDKIILATNDASIIEDKVIQLKGQ